MEKRLRELFGGKVRALRKAKSLTQEQLGERAGLHHTYIGAIERAECNLSMDNIEKIAKGLEVKSEELFAFSSEQISVSEKDKLVMEIAASLKERDVETLKQILNIVKEILKLADRE